VSSVPIAVRERIVEELERSQWLILAGEEVTPRWRVLCGDGDQVLVTPWLNEDHMRSRLALVRNFMLFKQQQTTVAGFVLLTETIEPNVIAATYVDRAGCLVIYQQIVRFGETISFGAMENAEADPEISALLPGERELLPVAQRAEAEQIFGPGGRFEANTVAMMSDS